MGRRRTIAAIGASMLLSAACASTNETAPIEATDSATQTDSVAQADARADTGPIVEDPPDDVGSPDVGSPDVGSPDIGDAFTAIDSDLEDASDVDAPPPLEPVYRIELRVHIGESTLPRAELAAALDEINFIWWSQAAICFEIHTVHDDAPMTTGFDLWYVPTLAEYPLANGIYYDDHSMYSRDYPVLAPAMTPVGSAAARTGSHELGHGLGLGHWNDQPDSSESLMASKQAGYLLHGVEIAAARETAVDKALPASGATRCAAPRID
jgi:hypothetical protein